MKIFDLFHVVECWELSLNGNQWVGGLDDCCLSPLAAMRDRVEKRGDEIAIWFI